MVATLSRIVYWKKEILLDLQEWPFVRLSLHVEDRYEKSENHSGNVEHALILHDPI